MKQFSILIVLLLLFSVRGTPVQAQIPSPTDNHTARAATSEGEPRLDHTRREEAEGKAIWDKLQAKQVECKNLTDDNFDSLGEYFMGQMAGSSHEAMNKMMVQMMGEKGEEQMHIVMGKRSSGCDTSVTFPSQGIGFMSMMNMLAPGGVEGIGGWFGFGWIFMILFWGLVLIGIIALIKWLVNQSKGEAKAKSPLDILKERYARGEIGKKEFEEMKKDFS